jgi:DNA sulfur modification protein DndC
LSESVFEKRKLSDIYEEIRTVYLSDNRPWILGFSGGKDSTCLAQLVWHALSELPEEQLQKKIYIISSDTLVESPKIVERILTTLSNIENAAKTSHLPISTNLLRPPISDTFWVRMLGLGYPAPTVMFRWCTDMLKINNADRFIQEKVSEYGEAIVLLGMRKNESTVRNKVMNLYKIENSLLSRHSKYAQTYVYTPIEEFSAEDVWNYLLQNKNPWGEQNRDLLALYQDANAAECPLVVDTSTQSCGNGRFGCWTCTVVDKDKTLGNFIEKGDDWMETLVELRAILKKTQEPSQWEKIREKKRRHGSVELRKFGARCPKCNTQNEVASEICKKLDCLEPLNQYTPGPYTMNFRRDFLEKLLQGQLKVQREGPNPNMELILEEEIHEIQRIWRVEQGDWQNSAYQIYEKVIGGKLESVKEDLGGFGEMEERLLEQVCVQHNVPSRLVSNLLNVEFDTQGATRHSKVYGKIKSELSKEWRENMDVIVKELSEERAEKDKVPATKRKEGVEDASD